VPREAGQAPAARPGRRRRWRQPQSSLPLLLSAELLPRPRAPEQCRRRRGAAPGGRRARARAGGERRTRARASFALLGENPTGFGFGFDSNPTRLYPDPTR